MIVPSEEEAADALERLLDNMEEDEIPVLCKSEWHPEGQHEIHSHIPAVMHWLCYIPSTFFRTDTEHTDDRASGGIYIEELTCLREEDMEDVFTLLRFFKSEKETNEEVVFKEILVSLNPAFEDKIAAVFKQIGYRK